VIEHSLQDGHFTVYSAVPLPLLVFVINPLFALFDVTQALVVAGTHATFFGQADQDGVTTNYRIDVDDLADPGAGMDTFKIQTDQGYVAGGFLTAGNITIHK
jgi:hypothetical protein